MGSYLAYVPKIYLKAHQNPRAFFYISGLIFLESSIQCPWGGRIASKSAMNYVFMGPRASYWILNSKFYEPGHHPPCEFRLSQNLLDGIVHFDYHLMTLEVGSKSSGRGNEC